MSPLRYSLSMLLGLLLVTFSLAASQNDRDGENFYDSGSAQGWTREFSAGRSYSVKSVSAPTRRGGRALRMETRYGDRENSYHSELEMHGAGEPGERAWYGFSTYVPTSWVDSEQTVITAQWWSHSRASPPLGIEIEGDEWVVFQRWDEGDEGLSKRAVGTVRKGEWTDWVVEAYWSDRRNGYVKVWRNGEVVYEREGPSVYRKTERLRFKLGVYAWPWKYDRPSPRRSSPRVIYHDEIRIGGENSSYNAVSPRD